MLSEKSPALLRYRHYLRMFGILFLLLISVMTAAAQDRILVFAGAASRPPTEEIASIFEKKTGIRVETVFGGSGYVLSQMKLAKQGGQSKDS